MMRARLVSFIFVLFFVSVLSGKVIAMGDSVSSKTFKELNEIQEVMGAGETEQAFTRLKTLLGNVKPDTLDKALTLQTLGYVEMARENFPEAIKHLKEALALNRLPQNVVYNVGYMVAQLYAAMGDYDQALAFAEDWYKQLESPKSSHMIFMANIYAQTKQHKESIPYAQGAIKTSDAPKESWFQLLTANYFELKQYNNAARTLERMLDRWPEKANYWEQLASVYVVLEEQKNALATLKIAFSQGILEKETTIHSLIQLAVSRGIPEHAARLLQAAIDGELLPGNKKYLEILASAYSRAKERDKAIDAYKTLAAVVDSGDPWMSISNLYMEQGKWSEAESSLDRALKKDLKEPGKAWLLLGIAQIEQGKYETSKQSLKKSSAYKYTEKSAYQWINYADDMKQQSDWLAENENA